MFEEPCILSVHFCRVFYQFSRRGVACASEILRHDSPSLPARALRTSRPAPPRSPSAASRRPARRSRRAARCQARASLVQGAIGLCTYRRLVNIKQVSHYFVPRVEYHHHPRAHPSSFCGMKRRRKVVLLDISRGEQHVLRRPPPPLGARARGGRGTGATRFAAARRRGFYSCMHKDVQMM